MSPVGSYRAHLAYDVITTGVASAALGDEDGALRIGHAGLFAHCRPAFSVLHLSQAAVCQGL